MVPRSGEPVAVPGRRGGPSAEKYENLALACEWDLGPIARVFCAIMP